MTKHDRGIDDTGETYWYNTRTDTVEEGPQSLAQYRLGPFPSREEAERALEIIAERSRRWAEEDAADER